MVIEAKTVIEIEYMTVTSKQLADLITCYCRLLGSIPIIELLGEVRQQDAQGISEKRLNRYQCVLLPSPSFQFQGWQKRAIWSDGDLLPSVCFVRRQILCLKDASQSEVVYYPLANKNGKPIWEYVRLRSV